MVTGLLIQSLFLTLLMEMGDRSQLTTLFLAANYRRPLVILSGAILGHLVATSTAIGAGEALLTVIPLTLLRPAAATIFIALGLKSLFEKVNGPSPRPLKWSLIWTSFLLIAASETGDKTWFLAIALSAGAPSVEIVFIGVLIALTATSVLAVILGETLLKRLSARWVKIASGGFLVLSGALMLLQIW